MKEGKPYDSNYGKISKIYINTSWTFSGKKTDQKEIYYGITSLSLA